MSQKRTKIVKLNLKIMADGNNSALGWVAPAANIVGSALGIFGQGNINKKNRKHQMEALRLQNQANMELAQYQWEQNLAMWREQNLYNSPSAQMARLEEAGLNPNLIYGSGSAPGNQSGPAPKFDRPEVLAEYAPHRLPDFKGILSAFQDFRLRDAQIDQVRATTENIKERTVTQGLLSLLRGYDLEQREAESDFFFENAQNKSLRIKAALESELGRLRQLALDEQQKMLRNAYMQNRISQQQIEKESKEVDLFMKQKAKELREAGFNEGDHILFRLLNRGLNEIGTNIWDLWQYFGK